MFLQELWQEEERLVAVRRNALFFCLGLVDAAHQHDDLIPVGGRHNEPHLGAALENMHCFELVNKFQITHFVSTK